MVLKLTFPSVHSAPDVCSSERSETFSHKSDMPPNTPKAVMKLRHSTFSLATICLAVACLSSTVVHLASILLDHATHNLSSGSGWILDIEFRHLIN